MSTKRELCCHSAFNYKYRSKYFICYNDYIRVKVGGKYIWRSSYKTKTYLKSSKKNIKKFADHKI